MRRLFSTLLFLSLPLLAPADDHVANTVVANTTSKNSQIVSTTASQWKLNEREWNRYLQLMQGVAGIDYKKFTPLEVLGLYADNDIERNHYAELYAIYEHDKTERELRFNNAFNAAAKRLYPDQPIVNSFDISKYTPIPKQTPNEYKAGDHLVLFTDLLNQVPERLIDRVKTNAGLTLDIYFVGTNDDVAIRNWAKANKIPFNLVLSNRITLSKDNGKFQKTGMIELPNLILVRDGISTNLRLE